MYSYTQVNSSQRECIRVLNERFNTIICNVRNYNNYEVNVVMLFV